MKKLWLYSITPIVVLALATGAFAQNLAKFEARPGTTTKLKLDGTSSIHDWSVETAAVGGIMELDSMFLADPSASRTVKIREMVETIITVRQLKTGTKAMDVGMYQVIKIQ